MRMMAAENVEDVSMKKLQMEWDRLTVLGEGVLRGGMAWYKVEHDKERKELQLLGES